jgi:uncharacterized protein
VSTTGSVRCALLAAALAGAGLLPPAAAAQKAVSVGTNPPGSVFHAVGSGLVKILDEAGVLKAAIQPHAGSSTFLPLLDSGELEFGVNTAIDAALAYRGPGFKVGGRNPFPHTPNLRLVMLGPQLLTAPLVRKDSPIRTMHEVRGKRVTGEYPAALATWYSLFGSLASAGLSWRDVQVVPVPGLPEGVDALTQRRADVTLFALNGAKVREADASVGVRHISLDCSPEGAQRVRAAMPGYYVHRVKRGEAAAVAEDLCVLGSNVYLTTGQGVPDAVVEAMVRTVWEGIDKLRPIHPIFKEWTREQIPAHDVTLPYHAGSVRFLKEKSSWTPEMERAQQQLLSAGTR